METFLYNTITQKREGPIREGRYLVDGKPGPLPENWVELTINKIPEPTYDYYTQTIEINQYADLQNNLWIIEPYIRDLSAQEIENRRPGAPSTCTPRQFRLALLHFNIEIQSIENMLNSIQDENKRKEAWIEWEYSIEIKREHPLISVFASQLNISKNQLDDIFNLAVTFD